MCHYLLPISGDLLRSPLGRAGHAAARGPTSGDLLHPLLGRAGHTAARDRILRTPWALNQLLSQSDTRSETLPFFCCRTSSSESAWQRRAPKEVSDGGRSGVWEHFTCFKDDAGKDKAQCKHCPVVLGADTRNGTSSLQAHIRICKGRERDAALGHSNLAPASSPSLPPQLLCARSRPDEPSSEPEPAGDHQKDEGIAGLARMIALHGYDPSVIDDDYFRSFVRHLNPEYELPSRNAVEEMCDAIFDEAREDILSKISNAPGSVSIAVGRVATVEGEVLYTACHFIDDDWNLHKVIVDAYYVDARSYPDCNDVVLGAKHVSLCPDDSEFSVNEVILDLSWRTCEVFGNMFLMVWDKKDDGVDHSYLLKESIENTCNNRTWAKVTCTYMDNVIRTIARLLTVHPGVCISNELWDLELTRQKRQKILSQLGLDYNVWAYGEPWYLTYCSLELLRKEEHSIYTEMAVMGDLLCKLYGEMYRAIQRISAFSCPTSNLCLVELFKLREVLQSQLALATGDNADAYETDNPFSDAGKGVADVLREAMDHLDGIIKDSYRLWSLPLILDPRYKLRYIEFLFKRAFSDSEAISCISEVTTHIREMYDHYIEDDADTSSPDSDLVTATAAAGSTDPLAEAWAEHCRSHATEVDSHLRTEKELDRYLGDGRIPPTPTDRSFDILSWWKNNSWSYPTLARMARDALAMPTCSKPSSEQLAHVRSIVRGYSKSPFVP